MEIVSVGSTEKHLAKTGLFLLALMWSNFYLNEQSEKLQKRF